MGNRVTITIRFRAGEVNAVAAALRESRPQTGGQRYEGWLDSMNCLAAVFAARVPGFRHVPFVNACHRGRGQEVR
jgi:hypothetical protein